MEDAAAKGNRDLVFRKGRGSDSGAFSRAGPQRSSQYRAEARELREDAEFTVTGQTFVPSCLIETGFLSNPRERERLTDPQYQEKLAEGIAKGIDLYFNPKTMYLTFDDGPSAENTSAVLDVLGKPGI